MTDFTVCIVTRGDVELRQALEPYIALDANIAIWDNSRQFDHQVLGRYYACDQAETSIVLVQDDDVVLAPETIQALLDQHEAWKITANMPARFRHDFYADHCLVGFGAIFERELFHRAFAEFWANIGERRIDDAAELFPRACDIVFTGLTPYSLIDEPYTDREFAAAPNRMWKQPDHVGERKWMLERVREVATR